MYINFFLKFDQIQSFFDFFWSNSNFLIIFVADLINFIMTIDLDSKNLNKKSD